MKIRKVILACFILFPAFLSADNKHTPAPPFEPTLPWLSDLDTALEQSRTTGKPILVGFR